MAAVLIGPQEVLVIVIVTAIVVFLLVRRKRWCLKLSLPSKLRKPLP